MDVPGRAVLPLDAASAIEAALTAFDAAAPPELALADGMRIPLPPALLDALRDVAGALARGQAVTVVPQHATLTTQQAAGLLGVSRPTFVKLLEDGLIPFTQPGRHRRVQLSEVLAYRERVRQERGRGLDTLAAVSRDAGLYGDDVSGTRLRRSDDSAADNAAKD